MRPELHAEAYGHAVTDAPLVEAFARIALLEGMTNALRAALQAAGVRSMHLARISLTAFGSGGGG